MTAQFAVSTDCRQCHVNRIVNNGKSLSSSLKQHSQQDISTTTIIMESVKTECRILSTISMRTDADCLHSEHLSPRSFPIKSSNMISTFCPMPTWCVTILGYPLSTRCPIQYIAANLPMTQTKILSKATTASGEKVAYGVQIDGKMSQNIYIDESNGGEIIVSGGTVNSPHLLMLSGIGDAEELERHNIPVVADVPGVGMVVSECLH